MRRTKSTINMIRSSASKKTKKRAVLKYHHALKGVYSMYVDGRSWNNLDGRDIVQAQNPVAALKGFVDANWPGAKLVMFKTEPAVGATGVAESELAHGLVEMEADKFGGIFGPKSATVERIRVSVYSLPGWS